MVYFGTLHNPANYLSLSLYYFKLICIYWYTAGEKAAWQEEEEKDRVDTNWIGLFHLCSPWTAHPTVILIKSKTLPPRPLILLWFSLLMNITLFNEQQCQSNSQHISSSKDKFTDQDLMFSVSWCKIRKKGPDLTNTYPCPPEMLPGSLNCSSTLWVFFYDTVWRYNSSLRAFILCTFPCSHILLINAPMTSAWLMDDDDWVEVAVYAV